MTSSGVVHLQDVRRRSAKKQIPVICAVDILEVQRSGDSWTDDPDLATCGDCLERIEAARAGLLPVISRASTIERCAAAVLAADDAEADFYEGRDAVESWALYALECALNGATERAEELLAAYANAPWSHTECPDDADHDEDDILHRSKWEL